MSVSSKSFQSLYKEITSPNIESFLHHVPQDLYDVYAALLKEPFGPYICQRASDALLYTESQKYTPSDISRILMTFADGLSQDHRLGDWAAAGHPAQLVLDVMVDCHSRLQALNTPIVAASVLVYYSLLISIRCYTHQPGSTIHPEANIDGVGPDDDLNWFYWDSFALRDQHALRYVGTKIYTLHLCDGACPVDALALLFKTKEFSRYGTNLYDKSEKKTLNTVTWLTTKAIALIKAVEKESTGTDPGIWASLITAVKVLTPSMSSSTTGAELCCEGAVFIPKEVEGQRLLSNLFRYHLAYNCAPEHQPAIQACADRAPSFMERKVSEDPRKGNAGGGSRRRQ